MSNVPGEDEAHMEFLEKRVGLLSAEAERLRDLNDDGVAEIMRLSAEVKRLREDLRIAKDEIAVRQQELQRLRAEAGVLILAHRIEEAARNWDVLCAALEEEDVPRVTDAERAEAQRVREEVRPIHTDP